MGHRLVWGEGEREGSRAGGPDYHLPTAYREGHGVRGHGVRPVLRDPPAGPRIHGAVGGPAGVGGRVDFRGAVEDAVARKVPGIGRFAEAAACLRASMRRAGERSRGYPSRESKRRRPGYRLRVVQTVVSPACESGRGAAWLLHDGDAGAELSVALGGMEPALRASPSYGPGVIRSKPARFLDRSGGGSLWRVRRGWQVPGPSPEGTEAHRWVGLVGVSIAERE